MRGLRYPGWCVEIREGALVIHHVQNCTNMNGPSTTVLNLYHLNVQIAGVEPGAKPIMVEDNPSLPFDKQVNNTAVAVVCMLMVQIRSALVFSMVADVLTQIPRWYRFWIDNFGYTQIVSCFRIL